jgi:uncharacterized protein YodC (DUF2158 family)
MAAKTGSGGSVGKMKSGGVRIIISKKKIKGEREMEWWVPCKREIGICHMNGILLPKII